jgi:hypothetical protein
MKSDSVLDFSPVPRTIKSNQIQGEWIMSQMPSNAPIMESRPGPAGWLPVWIRAVTQPNEQTFVDITEHPDATSKTAFIWIFIAGTVTTLVSGLIQAILLAVGIMPQTYPGMEELPGGGADMLPFVAGSSLVSTICAAPIAGVISVIGFAIGVAIIQWIAKMFGGTGTFDKLAYGIAAISVPLSLVSMLLTPLNVVPYLNYCTILLTFVFTIYALYLQVLAVKAVNRFGWGAALGSVFIPSLVIIFVCGCLVLGGLMLMGPAIGEVFSEINQSLQNAP